MQHTTQHTTQYTLHNTPHNAQRTTHNNAQHFILPIADSAADDLAKKWASVADLFNGNALVKFLATPKMQTPARRKAIEHLRERVLKRRTPGGIDLAADVAVCAALQQAAFMKKNVTYNGACVNEDICLSLYEI